MQPLNPSLEIQAHLKKIDREQSYIEDWHYEIGSDCKSFRTRECRFT